MCPTIEYKSFRSFGRLWLLLPVVLLASADEEGCLGASGGETDANDEQDLEAQTEARDLGDDLESVCEAFLATAAPQIEESCEAIARGMEEACPESAFRDKWARCKKVGEGYIKDEPTTMEHCSGELVAFYRCLAEEPALECSLGSYEYSDACFADSGLEDCRDTFAYHEPADCTRDDDSDERPTEPSLWLCDDYETLIPFDQHCDGKVDCPDDDSDEDFCGAVFVCDDGTAIPAIYKCDYPFEPDCPDGSDETSACDDY